MHLPRVCSTVPFYYPNEPVPHALRNRRNCSTRNSYGSRHGEARRASIFSSRKSAPIVVWASSNGPRQEIEKDDEDEDYLMPSYPYDLIPQAEHEEGGAIEQEVGLPETVAGVHIRRASLEQGIQVKKTGWFF